MNFETGFTPLNRKHVVVGTIFYGTGARTVEVFETDSILLADQSYHAILSFMADLLDPFPTASFNVEQYVRQDVPPGNHTMFTGDGQLFQYVPQHAEVTHDYDSRSEGI